MENPLAHLTPADLDALGARLDAIRDKTMADLGEQDADYIRSVIKAQRVLELGGRASLLVSLFPPAWLAGTAALSVAKILENMEIGHNVMHGQYDWMRDPEIHSTTWEWDSGSTSEQWKHAHNYVHHTFTNVVGKDRDLGYSVMRVSPEQPWHPVYLAQPAYNLLIAALFQWAIAIYDIELDEVSRGNKPWDIARRELSALGRKARRQFTKDYVIFPLLSGPSAVPTFFANLTANVVRNVWAHTIIFCGHFPDGAETFEFTEDELADETRGGWYVRQLLGSCNLEGGPLLHLMSGNLSHQIEHHLFPDVPSSRYAEIAPQVKAVCEEYGLPYTGGPLWKQYGQVMAKILRYSLPGGEIAPTPSASARSATASDSRPSGESTTSAPNASRIPAIR